MESFTVKQILSLNEKFYQSVAKSFSKTRERPWEGWDVVLESLPLDFWKRNTKVLDIACGNGRFFEYLEERVGESSFFGTGVDSCEELLSIAKDKLSSFKNITLRNNDVISQNLGKDRYQLVTGFGITHHIPSNDLRKEWFKKISGRLAKNGFLVLTFWIFNTSKAARLEKFTSLDKGDFFLDRKDFPGVYRYCHLYSETEILEIVSFMKQLNMSLYKDFDDDKRAGSHNRYLIFKKQAI